MLEPLTHLDQLTTEWLREALSPSVGANVPLELGGVEPLCDGRGHLATVARVRLSDRPAGLPPTLIVKLASSSSAAFVRSWGLGRREALFYRQLAGLSDARGPLVTPRCHAALHDARGSFTLLLEDLGAATTTPQALGASAEQASDAICALAEHHAWFQLHQARWAGETQWLPRPNTNRELFQALVTRGWQTCQEHFSELPTSLPDVRRGLDQKYPAALDALSREPLTLVHGDYRLDNMFFRSSVWQHEFAAVDWQLVSRARGAWDLANFVHGSLDLGQEPNSLHWYELYHAKLVEAGVRDLPFDELQRDCDHALLASFSMAAVLTDQLRRWQGELSSAAEAWLRRVAHAVPHALERLSTA